MLLSQHFGRCHQRALVTALHRGQQAGDRNDGLPRADVALQQPVHRDRVHEIAEQLLDRALLGSGQVEGEVVEPADGQLREHLPVVRKIGIVEVDAHDLPVALVDGVQLTQ